MLVLVVWVQVCVVVPGAVGPAVASVHGAVEEADAGVRVLVFGPLQCAAGVQDLCVVPLPGLALPQLPGLGLDPGGQEGVL